MAEKGNYMLEQLLPNDVKKCTKSELNVLCDELRHVIYDTVMKCGGHLSSNLGAVEPTVALCYVFDFPKDKIVFDVGHQCYAYKLLTGRYQAFSTLRQKGGVSGFPKRMESEYDSYDTGHAGTALSAALGIAKARDLKGEDGAVIAFIGDGSFNNGLIYEALNSLKILNTKVLIVLNDNGMSISPTVGGMHEILDSIKNGEKAERVRLLESFSLKYVGVKNGNDAEEMVDAFTQAKELLKESSVLLHIVTKKGKGYEFSEENPTETHGVAPSGKKKGKEYSEVLGETLVELAKEDKRITAVTAAMTESLGLEKFFAFYPERAFDVGICEENACVLCSSMATMGLKPYYAIYSTFLQRAFDEIVHDVCAQDLPVTFCVDRAGISGADGETHQGVFDLSYLSLIPNLAIATPKDTEELVELLKFSKDYLHPLVIRYPRLGKAVFEAQNGEKKPIELGKWEYLHKSENAKLTVIGAGERVLTLAENIRLELNGLGLDFDIVNARFVKPVDEEMLSSIRGTIVTMEDNVKIGGFGESVKRALSNTKQTVKIFAYDDQFIPQGTVSELQEEYGLSREAIKNYIQGVLV